MDKEKEKIQKLYEQFGKIVGTFFQTIDDCSLYIVFEKVIDEMNRRRKKEQKENE